MVTAQVGFCRVCVSCRLWVYAVAIRAAVLLVCGRACFFVWSSD